MATSSFTPHTWTDGETITKEKLNTLETAVKTATDGVIALEGADAPKQGASYRISTETFSASKADCQASAVSPGASVLPIIVGDLIEDATGAVWQVAAVADGTFTVGAAAVKGAA